MNNYDIRRGDIFYIYKDGRTVGSEQYSGRPAVVVSNDLCNENSDVIEIVFCTTKPKEVLPTHVKILSTPQESTVLCEQIQSVSVERFGDFLSSCTPGEMDDIDKALRISLALNSDKSEKTSEPCLKFETELLKAQVERDTYKKLYEELLAKIIEGKTI